MHHAASPDFGQGHTSDFVWTPMATELKRCGFCGCVDLTRVFTSAAAYLRISTERTWCDPICIAATICHGPHPYPRRQRPFRNVSYRHCRGHLPGTNVSASSATGVFANATYNSLYGQGLQCTYQYFRRYPKDRYDLKALVSLLCAIASTRDSRSIQIAALL